MGVFPWGFPWDFSLGLSPGDFPWDFPLGVFLQGLHSGVSPWIFSLPDGAWIFRCQFVIHARGLLLYSMVQILLDFKYVSTSNNWAIEWVDLNWRFFSLPCVSHGMQYALSFPIIRAPALGLLSLKMHLYKFFYVLFALHFFLLKMNADWKLKLIYEFIQKFLLYLPSTYLNCNWFSMVCSSL